MTEMKRWKGMSGPGWRNKNGVLLWWLWKTFPSLEEVRREWWWLCGEV